MKNENNNTKENIKEEFDWFGKAEGIVMSFLKGLLKIGVETINERVREFYALVRKNIAGSFVMMVGFIFLLVGLAIFINDLLGISQGVGYAIIGIVAILTGLIIIKK